MPSKEDFINDLRSNLDSLGAKILSSINRGKKKKDRLDPSVYNICPGSKGSERPEGWESSSRFQSEPLGGVYDQFSAEFSETPEESVLDYFIGLRGKLVFVGMDKGKGRMIAL